VKTTVFVFATLSLAFALGFISLHDPGYVLISRAPFQIEMSLALFIVIVLLTFVTLYLSVRVLFRTLQARRDLRKWRDQRVVEKAGQDIIFGYAKLIEGNWAEAERELLQRVDHSSTPLLNHLGAAYAAQQNDQFDKRDHYLDLAFNGERKFRDAVQLTRIRLQYQAGQYEAAKITLRSMSASVRKKRVAQRMEAEIYLSLSDWDMLQKQLPLYRKGHSFSDSELVDMEQTVFKKLLTERREGTGGQLVSKTWARVPKSQRKDPELIETYCRELVACGKLSEAEVQLKAALSNNWSSQLVRFYGEIKTSNSHEKLKQCELWEKQFPNDAVLALVIARLKVRLGNSESAQESYASSLRLGASEEAFLELGQMLEQSGEVDEARRCYKRGLEFTLRQGTGQNISDGVEPALLLTPPDDIIDPRIVR
jgi:HemY protein